MSTLAYYSTLVKKESLMDRIHLDAEELASVANNLVCEIKVASASCKNRDIESILNSITQAEESIKIVNAMLNNLKNNTQAYLLSLSSQREETTTQQEPQQEVPQQPTSSPEEKISNIVDVIKSLKEMQQSLDNK